MRALKMSPIAWTLILGAAQAVLALPGEAGAQEAAAGEEPAQIEWLADLEAALEWALENELPVFVAIHGQDDTAREAVRDLYAKKELADLLDGFVCLVGSPAQHEEDPASDGRERRACKLFGRIPCAEHQAVFRAYHERLELDPAATLHPQHLLLDRAGGVVHRRAFAQDLDVVAAMVTRVRRGAGLPLEGEGAPARLPEEEQESFAKETFKAARRESFRFGKRRELTRIFDLGTAHARSILLEYLEKGDDDVLRGEVVGVLAGYGECTVLADFRRAAQDGKDYVSLAAVDGLRKLGLPGAAPDLQKLLRRHKQGKDRGRTLLAYASCAARDPGALALVLKDARHHEAARRSYGLVALHHFPPTEPVVEILSDALEDRVTRIRAAGIWAAGMGRFEECRAGLKEVLERERVTEIREMAQRAVRRLDGSDQPSAGPNGIVATFESLLEDWVPLRDDRHL